MFKGRKALRRNSLLTCTCLVFHMVPVTSEARDRYLWNERSQLEKHCFLSAVICHPRLFLILNYSIGTLLECFKLRIWLFEMLPLSPINVQLSSKAPHHQHRAGLLIKAVLAQAAQPLSSFACSESHLKNSLLSFPFPLLEKSRPSNTDNSQNPTEKQRKAKAKG